MHPELEQNLINGVLLGLKGILQGNSVIKVYDIVFMWAPSPIPLLKNFMTEEFILFLSGLDVGRERF